MIIDHAYDTKLDRNPIEILDGCTLINLFVDALYPAGGLYPRNKSDSCNSKLRKFS